MFSESPPSYRSVVVPQLITPGIAIPVFYDEIADPPPASKQLEGLAIPSFPQLYKKIKGTPPSGELWNAYRTLFAMPCYGWLRCRQVRRAGPMMH
jgi:hypothetical protein